MIKKENLPIKVFVIISIIIVLIQIGVGLIIYYSLDDWSSRGNFGDMFGVIGSLFSGLALAGVIYTILLQREELKNAEKSQMKLEKSLTEQAVALMETARLNVLSIFPALNCRIRVEESQVYFVTENPSYVSAFDVDIWISGTYSEDDLDLPTFVADFVPLKKLRNLNQFTSTREGFYGVYERLFFPMFPQRQQNCTELYFPILPGVIYCFVQFRDLRGTNYHQMYWFFMDDEIYRLGYLNPKTPVEAPKIDFSPKLTLKESDPIPDYLDEFVEFWNSSIPSGYLMPITYPSVEDRGNWKSI